MVLTEQSGGTLWRNAFGPPSDATAAPGFGEVQLTQVRSLVDPVGTLGIIAYPLLENIDIRLGSNTEALLKWDPGAGTRIKEAFMCFENNISLNTMHPFRQAEIRTLPLIAVTSAGSPETFTVNKPHGVATGTFGVTIRNGDPFREFSMQSLTATSPVQIELKSAHGIAAATFTVVITGNGGDLDGTFVGTRLSATSFSIAVDNSDGTDTTTGTVKITASGAMSIDGAYTATPKVLASVAAADAGGSATLLNDAETDFEAAGVTPGDYVINVTDTALPAIVVSVATNALTTTPLRGGTSNTYATADVCSVVGSRQFTIALDNSVGTAATASGTVFAADPLPAELEIQGDNAGTTGEVEAHGRLFRQVLVTTLREPNDLTTWNDPEGRWSNGRTIVASNDTRYALLRWVETNTTNLLTLQNVAKRGSTSAAIQAVQFDEYRCTAVTDASPIAITVDRDTGYSATDSFLVRIEGSHGTPETDGIHIATAVSGTQFTIVVDNSGAGIDAEDLGRIYAQREGVDAVTLSSTTGNSHTSNAEIPLHADNGPLGVLLKNVEGGTAPAEATGYVEGTLLEMNDADRFWAFGEEDTASSDVQYTTLKTLAGDGDSYVVTNISISNPGDSAAVGLCTTEDNSSSDFITFASTSGDDVVKTGAWSVEVGSTTLYLLLQNDDTVGGATPIVQASVSGYNASQRL